MKKPKTRKPKGYGAFDELARKLVQVPKDEVPKDAPKVKTG